MSQFSFEQKIEIVSKMALDYCNENGLKFKQYNQKFAELIVRECVWKVYNHPVLFRNENYKFEDLLLDIKKELGVKEL